MHTWMIASTCLAACVGFAFGCGGVGDLQYAASSSGQTGSGGTTAVTGSTGSTGSGATGIPCDLATVFTTCLECHGHPTIGGAQGSLVTYADLTSPALSDSSKTMAEMALERIQSTSAPMPPAGLPPETAAQIKTLSDWVAAGSPMGSCDTGSDGGTTPDPTFTGTSTCASGRYYQGEDGSLMDPGQACINCHASRGGEAPRFSIAGTVFATGHVPDNCLPTSAQSADLTQAKVVITDHNNKVTTLNVNTNGNFSSNAAIALPFTAKVVYQGKTRAMATPQSTGDCNSCHTDSGVNSAPGRIALP